MGMISQIQGKKATGGNYGTGTSSFPVTGFPASAYRGNNRKVGGGAQGQPSPLAGAIGSTTQLDSKQLAIVLGVLVVVGYGAWHLDNRKR